MFPSLIKQLPTCQSIRTKLQEATSIPLSQGCSFTLLYCLNEVSPARLFFSFSFHRLVLKGLSNTGMDNLLSWGFPVKFVSCLISLFKHSGNHSNVRASYWVQSQSKSQKAICCLKQAPTSLKSLNSIVYLTDIQSSSFFLPSLLTLGKQFIVKC